MKWLSTLLRWEQSFIVLLACPQGMLLISTKSATVQFSSSRAHQYMLLCGESPTEASETLNEIEEQSHSERQENELNKDEQLRPGEIPHITAESPTQPEPKTTQEIPASIPEHPPEYKHEESVHRDEENEQRTEIVDEDAFPDDTGVDAPPSFTNDGGVEGEIPLSCA
ncbi:hypothetical protein Tcan_05062 [Toxocara canis]|uniref:Uncharacterized protein n=1 Tax=Toxocara canis TaxID=6265 RepID=A0A0B2V5R3_TOXCA|nr:hypothetical protein Tcan_05062 [Toxocara canis]